MCRGCHGFCSEVLKKMRQGCDEDENDEVLVSWLVVFLHVDSWFLSVFYFWCQFEFLFELWCNVSEMVTLLVCYCFCTQ